MADYVYLEKNSKNGKLGIHRHVFDQLVTSSLTRVKGIAKSQKYIKKSQFIILNRPVQTYVVNDIVHIWIFIDIVKGKNVQNIVREIQDEVYNSLLLITEQVPVNVQVKIESII